jgi:hypothetical protein
MIGEEERRMVAWDSEEEGEEGEEGERGGEEEGEESGEEGIDKRRSNACTK